MSPSCLFCEIIKKRVEASIVYEDSNVLAFLDIYPASIGHTLIIPKEHYENIFETPEKTLAQLIAAVKKISFAVKKAMGVEGVKIIQLNGKVAGQVVMHIHFHVIPIGSKKE